MGQAVCALLSQIAHTCAVACRVQVLYELLKRDPEGASIPDDDCYLPIEVAADKAYDQPTDVMNLVIDMLQNPANVTRLSGNSKDTRQQDQPIWGVPAQSISGMSCIFLSLACHLSRGLLFL